MANPLLLEGEIHPEYPTEPDALEKMRADFRDFAEWCSRRIAELDNRLAAIQRGLSAAAGDVPLISPDANKWQQIKSRLSPRLQEAVDIFLVQGTMRRTQLASAMKMDYSNCVKNVVGVLLRQGLIVDNGKELSLKQL